ncbi:protein of unknown function [Candidatus Methylopumilus turicensis]|uniref:Uncharacterized protein n=1 Tax=Candidatus Methylopumilus turicensis TaxID=1581680 RepID=A0A0B7J173_9PROT|nr:protein of unknown function [Candidatus Methylopumilus turicensis]
MLAKAFLNEETHSERWQCATKQTAHINIRASESLSIIDSIFVFFKPIFNEK